MSTFDRQSTTRDIWDTHINTKACTYHSSSLPSVSCSVNASRHSCSSVMRSDRSSDDTLSSVSNACYTHRTVSQTAMTVKSQQSTNSVRQQIAPASSLRPWIPYCATLQRYTSGPSQLRAGRPHGTVCKRKGELNSVKCIQRYAQMDGIKQKHTRSEHACNINKTWLNVQCSPDSPSPPDTCRRSHQSGSHVSTQTVAVLYVGIS